jgi:hypothetical protein
VSHVLTWLQLASGHPYCRIDFNNTLAGSQVRPTGTAQMTNYYAMIEKKYIFCEKRCIFSIISQLIYFSVDYFFRSTSRLIVD